MKLSKNFDSSEFACKCGCGFDDVNPELVEVLQEIRDHFGPVKINSACRCESHNARVGGSPKSQHKAGTAADIVVKGVTPLEVQKFVKKRWAGCHGIGSYKTFTHIDVRGYCARW